METFFFISLGITFILILLLVYHFKQRILTVEQKGDTLFEIINNLIMETSSLKQYVRSLPMFFNRGSVEPQNTMIMHQHDPIIDDDEEEEEYEEEEEDEEDDEEPNPKIVVSDDEYGSNIEMNIKEMTEFLSDMKNNEEQEEEVGELNLEELELQEDMIDEDNDAQELELDAEVALEEEAEVPQEPEHEIKMEEQNMPSVDHEDASKKTVDLGIVPDYRKMSLSELKTAVLSKSLAQDVSKMKKNQLLQLLGM